MPGVAHRQDEFTATYPTTTGAIAQARAEFSSWLLERSTTDDMHDEMLIVLSELLGNAVAASVDAHQQVAVQACVDDDSVTLEVTNPPATRSGHVDRWDYDDPLRPGGRGLLIVEALVDDLAILPPDGDRSLSVRCRRERLPSRR